MIKKGKKSVLFTYRIGNAQTHLFLMYLVENFKTLFDDFKLLYYILSVIKSFSDSISLAEEDFQFVPTTNVKLILLQDKTFWEYCL